MKPLNSIRVMTLSMLLTGILVAVPAMAAQAGTDLQIGVVNAAELIQKAPQAEAARNRLKKKFSSRRHKLQELRQKITEQTKKLKKDSSAMSSSVIQSKKKSLHDKQRHFRQLKQNYNEDVKQSEREAFGKLRNSIQKVIVKVAKENGYDLVLSNGIVYANDKVDITSEILDTLRDKAGND